MKTKMCPLYTHKWVYTHTHTHSIRPSCLWGTFYFSLAKFIDVTASITEQFPCKSFMLQSMSEVNQRVTMQKPMHMLPGDWGQPMLSLTVKIVACRGILHLFLSCEEMFLPTKVSAFMA